MHSSSLRTWYKTRTLMMGRTALLIGFGTVFRWHHKLVEQSTVRQRLTLSDSPV